MGGKHKVANRTKNNARPSNSGRSAELLGTSLPQFVSFSGMKETGFGGFSLTNTEDLDASLESNFQLALKKLSKKDATTKLKGLQEFADLVKSSESDAVKSVLPIWPRYYNILATDTDNRVREAAHNALYQIVIKVKRNIAPFLKQIMAPWFTSQYDTYPPAASIASQAFKETFPANKFQEAIIFCQEEILLYIKENLIDQSAQNLANSKSLSAEEAEAKYERVLISCLQGYYLYLSKVPKQEIEKATDLNNSIVSNSKFWKLAKHKIAPIRAAWFEVLTAICQNAIILLDSKSANVTVTVFSNLDESDPTVMPYVWESALLIMSSIKEWWTFISIDKLFLPKLNKVLKQGAQGTATVIYPNLLPLLSHLPPSVDQNSFYSEFFENIRTSLKQKNVVASRSESVAITSAIFECLQYVLLKNQGDVNLCKKLISEQIISTIEWCLLNNQACHKTIFNKVSSLAQYWSRQQNQEGLENYKIFLDFFFENICDLIKYTLYNLKGSLPYDVSDVTSKQIDLLQCLKHITKNKKQNKVQFKEEDQLLECTDETSGTSVINDDPYLRKLNSIVYIIAQEYVTYIETHRCKDLLKHFYSLVLEFDTKSFFYNLTKKMTEKKSEFLLINIFNNLLYKWLVSQDLCCQHVVDLIFLLFNYVDEKDKNLIMTSLSKLNSNECLGWCISQALSHPINKNLTVQNWLKTDTVTEFIVDIADKEINDVCTPELSVLFKLALTENENGELFIQKQAVKKIIDKLIDVLENEENHIITFDSCCSLAAYISAIVYTDHLLLEYGDKLLFALFKLSCKHNYDPEIMSPETIYEVNSSWEDAISLLSSGLKKDEFLGLSHQFGIVIDEYFSSILVSVTVLTHLTKVVVNYIKSCHRNVDFTKELIDMFVNREFVTVQNEKLTNLFKAAEYIKGNLSSPYDEIKFEVGDINEHDIYKYFVWSFFKLNIISNNISADEDFDGDDDDEDDEDDDDNDAEKDIGDQYSRLILSVLENPTETFCNTLYDYTLCNSYLDGYKNVKYYYEIKSYSDLLENRVKEILKIFNKDNNEKLKLLLKEKSLSQSWLWCKTVYLLYKHIAPTNVSKIYDDFLNGIPKGQSLCRIQLTQLFCSDISYDYVQNQFDAVESIVILRSLLHCDEIDVQIAEVFKKIENIRNEQVPQFLYETHTISWTKTQEIIEIIRLCSGLINNKIALNRRHWDFGVLSLVSWASNSFKARGHFQKIQVQALVVAVTGLYISTEKQISMLKEKNDNNSYVNEWQDVLVETIHADLAQLWLYFAEQFETMEYSSLISYIPFIQEFGQVVNYFKYDYIFKFNESSLPKWTKYLKKSCSLLSRPLPTLQLWGYKMLLKLVPGLVTIDYEAVKTNTPHKKGLIFEQFKEKLVETHEIVNSMLMDFKLGEDSCTVSPSTDSFTYTFAYLLLWDVLLSLCETSSTELTYQYADWLRNEDLLKNFLNNLFRLMPTEVFHYSEGKSKTLLDTFLKSPSISIKDDCSSGKIEKMVCWLYASALEQLPAAVRQWWSAVDSRIAQVVEKVTTVYVSPHLCTNELTNVAQHETKFKNMTVRVVPTVREVIAVYTVDEAQMELVITLPINYPLCGPEVQFSKHVGLPTHRQWLLQFKKCVLFQNGSIWDGLSLWHNNLEKKYDGVEECYICFCTLHPGTFQLPKLSCQTCKKKFHSACLYKWFSTSNKSTCPICRNLF